MSIGWIILLVGAGIVGILFLAAMIAVAAVERGMELISHFE